MKTHLLLYTHYLWLGVSKTGMSHEKWIVEEEEGERGKRKIEIEIGTSDTKLYLAFIHLQAGSLCAPRATNEEAAATLLL